MIKIEEYLKDALFIVSIILGIALRTGDFNIPIWVFIAMLTSYIFLRIT